MYLNCAIAISKPLPPSSDCRKCWLKTVLGSFKLTVQMEAESLSPLGSAGTELVVAKKRGDDIKRIEAKERAENKAAAEEEKVLVEAEEQEVNRSGKKETVEEFVHPSHENHSVEFEPLQLNDPVRYQTASLYETDDEAATRIQALQRGKMVRERNIASAGRRRVTKLGLAALVHDTDPERIPSAGRHAAVTGGLRGLMVDTEQGRQASTRRREAVQEGLGALMVAKEAEFEANPLLRFRGMRGEVLARIRMLVQEEERAAIRLQSLQRGKVGREGVEVQKSMSQKKLT